MHNIMNKLSVKKALTFVLSLFSALILLIAALGYQSTSLGVNSIDELNRINVQQLSMLNRAQVNIADTKLFFINYFDAMNEGDATLADAYLDRAIQMLQRAQELFDAFVAIPMTEMGKPYADAVVNAFNQLTSRGLEPQYEALTRKNESYFRGAKHQGDHLNLTYMQANEAFIEYASARG